MAKQKKLKEWIAVAAAVILVILLSAGTSIIVNRHGAVQSAAKIKNGLSAYELAVSEGYSGTLQEWLVSLKGDSAYKTAVNAGYKGTENEWTQSLNALVSSGFKSIKTASFNSAGQLVLILSDGTELNLGNAVGKNGANGKDGINGSDGKDGKDGANGTDGVSISGTSVNADGELVITFSDNKTVNVGKIVGATGLKGEKGDTGRGIAKTEIIDGYLWVTYTDDLENPINVGKVSENNNNECLKFTRISKSTLSVSIKEEYKTFVKKVIIPSEYYGFKVTSIGKKWIFGV